MKNTVDSQKQTSKNSYTKVLSITLPASSIGHKMNAAATAGNELNCIKYADDTYASVHLYLK